MHIMLCVIDCEVDKHMHIFKHNIIIRFDH